MYRSVHDSSSLLFLTPSNNKKVLSYHPKKDFSYYSTPSSRRFAGLVDGKPALTKEEDLELTRKVIMEQQQQEQATKNGIMKKKNGNVVGSSMAKKTKTTLSLTPVEEPTTTASTTTATASKVFKSLKPSFNANKNKQDLSNLKASSTVKASWVPTKKTPTTTTPSTATTSPPTSVVPDVLRQYQAETVQKVKETTDSDGKVLLSLQRSSSKDETTASSSSTSDSSISPPEKTNGQSNNNNDNKSVSSDANKVVLKRTKGDAAPLSTTEEVASLTTTTTNTTPIPQLSKWQSNLVKLGMILYIASMCVALPVTLLPQRLLYKLRLIHKTTKEKWALRTGQWCARRLLTIIPFCKVDTIGYEQEDNRNSMNNDEEPEPAIWVCNHTSMLDIFILLATDKRLRGKNKRPIKIVYWKGLEENPVTRLLFRQCGFIPVEMADNGHGTDNEYDVSSFRQLLKDTKAAIAEGFDIGVLPEGQLNPTPEFGLLPVFSGAFTLAKLAKRPIHMMALYGVHHLWHPNDGMVCRNRHVKIRCYGTPQRFTNAKDFSKTFTKIVGHFGQTGQDVPDLDQLLQANP